MERPPAGLGALWTPEEMMAVVMARLVRDGETVGVGALSPIPSARVSANMTPLRGRFGERTQRLPGVASSSAKPSAKGVFCR